MSAPSPSRRLTLSRSAKPYISLDDPHTQEFFTKDRVRKHLRRAGLINKHGEILTEAEYASQQTDVAIGRDNQRKIDDAITEVLKDMAREHWAYSREYVEALRKDLLNQFRRIENQYRRRNQPITIRHSPNGRVHLESVQAITDPLSVGSENSPRLSAETFPPIQSGRSSHPALERQSTNLTNLWQEINNIKDALTNLNRESNTDSIQVLQNLIMNLTKNYESLQERQEIFLNRKLEEDNRQAESSNQISSAIEELKNRILILETSVLSLPKESSSEAIDQTVETNENTAIESDHAINNTTRRLDERIRENQILTRNNPRRELETQEDNNDWKNLARATMEKVNHLEMQFNQFFQSSEDNILRSPINESVDSARLLQQQPTSRASKTHRRDSSHSPNAIPSVQDLASIERRLIALEKSPFNTNDNLTTTLENLVEENFRYFQLLEDRIHDLNRQKPAREEMTYIRGSLEQQFNKQLEHHDDKIMKLLEKKSNHQEVLQLLENSKEQTNQMLNELNRSLADNQHALDGIENYISDLYRRLNQQSKTTSTEVAEQNSEENSVTPTPTSKELQPIMPFVEFLPTFDMLNENEWT